MGGGLTRTKAPIRQRGGSELGGRSDEPEEGKEEDGGDLQAADEYRPSRPGVVDEEAGGEDCAYALALGSFRGGEGETDSAFQRASGRGGEVRCCW